MLEHLSQQQGTGDITLFFPTGSAALPKVGCNISGSSISRLPIAPTAAGR